MATSCDTLNLSKQLEVAGLDTRQAGAVAEAIRYSRDPDIIRAELNAALPRMALGVVAANVVLAVVLIQFL